MKRRNLTHQLICVAIGLLAPIFAWAQTPNLNMTPFRIVNKVTGLCIHQWAFGAPNNDLVFDTATCSDSDSSQKFYILNGQVESPYVPERAGPANLVRIVLAPPYEGPYGPDWYNLYAESAEGSRVHNHFQDTQFPPINGIWIFNRTGGGGPLTNTQYEGVITNGQTQMCISYKKDATPISSPIVVSASCGMQEVWRLEPTTYAYAS